MKISIDSGEIEGIFTCMKTGICAIDPTADCRRDRFVINQKQATVYHTSAWATVINKSYGYSPRYYVLDDSADQIKASIPYNILPDNLVSFILNQTIPMAQILLPVGRHRLVGY